LSCKGLKNKAYYLFISFFISLFTERRHKDGADDIAKDNSSVLFVIWLH